MACLLLLIGEQIALADQWTFFHPESVIGISCNVELVDSSIYPTEVHSDVFQAEAHANRNDKTLGDWSMTVAVYPATTKGRHQAEKACSLWMDAAGKRMRGVRK